MDKQTSGTWTGTRAEPHTSPDRVKSAMVRLLQAILLASRRKAFYCGALLTAILCLGYITVGWEGHVSTLEKAHGPLSSSTAIYLWCRTNEDLEFKQYLGLRSIISHFRPNKLIFYYLTVPTTDEWMYNTWFTDLKAELGPTLHLERLSYTVCSSPAKMKEFVMKALIGSGGLYVGENTLVTPAVSAFRPDLLGTNDMVMNLEGNMQGFAYVSNKMTTGKGDEGSVPVRYFKTLMKPCSTMVNTKESVELLTETHCVLLDPSLQIYPKDIIEMDSKFGMLAREAMYGITEPPKPAQSNSTLIPKVAHIWWLGGLPISFLCYLSVLSHLFVVGVDTVFIYGDQEPSGPYWNRLQKYHPRVQYVEHLGIVSYKGVYIKSPSLQSDVFRAEIMVEKGGIYTDVDALFLKPIDDLRMYDAVASLDILAEKGRFPEYFNLGVTMGKKGAPFWKQMMKGMEKFHPELYGYNGLAMPYKIWEKHPSWVYHNPHLQVICHELKCKPTWVPNFLNASVHKRSNFDWRTDAYAVHFTYPTPRALTSEKALKESDNQFAQIGKFIYEKAGLKL